LNSAGERTEGIVEKIKPLGRIDSALTVEVKLAGVLRVAEAEMEAV
jgi:hypothetical protein